MFGTETHIKRLVTQQGCLPCLLGDGNKEGPLSFVLFEFPFVSVSTVSRAPPPP